MQEYAVKCGCGRSMTLDGVAGAGAYRCGCGARVKLSASPAAPRACWWENCGEQAATDRPVSLCREHVGQALRHLVGRQGYRALWGQATDDHLAEHPPVQPEAKPTWVYFMRREKLIKIGYSNSPERRASQLGAKILVTVPGGPEQERAFHVVYRALNAGGEWFEPGPDLIGTINLLRRDQSLPPLDLTT